MVSTEGGNITDVRFLQKANAIAPMLLRPVGSVTELKAPQLKKKAIPMLVTESGKTNVFREKH
jgi:hypothetical protein